MSEMNYLDRLLNGVAVEWKRLGDVARIKNGKDHKALGEGGFPVYGSGGIMRYADAGYPEALDEAMQKGLHYISLT